MLLIMLMGVFRRNTLLSDAAQDLEFQVHAFSSTQEGYENRAKTQILAVKQLKQAEAWSSNGNDEFEDTRDIVKMLRKSSKSLKPAVK